MSNTSTHTDTEHGTRNAEFGTLYLSRGIAEARETDAPRYGRTADGYTVRAGAPSPYLVRLDGETRFRRVYVWQFSNAGTAFLRIGGEPHILTHAQECEVQDLARKNAEALKSETPAAR